MIHTKPIGLIAAFVLGLATMNPPTASCKPKGYKDQRQYAQVLNPLATSVMSWYGYLVTPKQQRSREVQDDVKKLFDTAEAPSSYQQRYPSRIRNIDILEAGLDRQGLHKFEFHIESRVFYWVSNQLRMTQIAETFVFVIADSQRPRITAIEREKEVREMVTAPKSTSDRGDVLHYQLRRFAYAWLAYMDREADQLQQEPTQDGIEQAVYDITFGAMTFRGNVETTLQQRREHQGSGGHLLRSLTVLKRSDQTRQVTIELIIDWRGKSPHGLNAIGKIRQEISLTISDSGHIEVATIQEKHLLPDLEPWTKLLC